MTGAQQPTGFLTIDERLAGELLTGIPYAKWLEKLRGSDAVAAMEKAIGKRKTEWTKDVGKVTAITPPAGSWFESSAPYTVYRRSDGRYDITESYSGAWAAATAGLTVETFYIDTESGDNGNDGTTWDDALATVNQLTSEARYTSAAAAVVYIRGTVIASGNNGTAFSGKTVRVIGVEGARFIAGHPASDYSWVQQSAPNGSVYLASLPSTPGSPRGAVDFQRLDAFGDPIPYTEQASLVATQANEFSQYGGSNSCYIHIEGGADPTGRDDLFILHANGASNLQLAAASKLFIEDLRFYGSVSAVLSTGAFELYASNCLFCASRISQNTFGTGSTGGTGKVRLWDCIASNAGSDGFNWHAYSGATLDAVEVRCTARYCGRANAPTGSNQGSTAHDGIKLARVGCRYEYNYNQNITDINTSTETWNVGCQFGNAISEDASADQGVDINISTSATGYFDRCERLGGSKAESLRVQTSSTVKVTNSEFSATDFTGAGTAQDY